MVKRWNVPKPPSDPREEIAAHYGASGAVAGVGTGMARTFRGAHPNFLKDRQAYAQREMDQEYKNPHPDPGVHNAYMMHLADMHNSARDELARQAHAESHNLSTMGEPRYSTESMLYRQPGGGMGKMVRLSIGDQPPKIELYKVDNDGRETFVRHGIDAEWQDEKSKQQGVADQQALQHHVSEAHKYREQAANAGAKGLTQAEDFATRMADKHADAARAIQTGPRGGKHYVTATGAKVYVKDNPGATVVGHMSNQRFHQGLPMSAHLAEPKKVR
jgi:hypothetical protein